MGDVDARYRIGELAKRVGMSPELLRAWESRYGVLRPSRSTSGYRLYSDEDIVRIRRMQELLRGGVSAADAARLVASESVTTGGVAPNEIRGVLDRALVDFDEPAAHAALDRLFSTVTIETALREAILPALRRIGERWAAGTLSVAQEHFASTLLRSRLLAIARGWDQGVGKRAILACAPGELHDIGLIAFGMTAHRRGWRIVYLGQDTPTGTLADAAERVKPDLVVVSATASKRYLTFEPELSRLGRKHALGIGGAGAGDAIASRIHARYLGDDAVAAGEALS